jgi:4,5:9,10-diseco-3-hydroxy-5,9,17-trioxoandrosta-1(10),2-diene-4-oate hydrolase
VKSVGYDDVFGNFTSAAGVSIHHGDLGDGPPVLMLHGTGPGANAWVNFRHNIGDLAEDFRVIPVDMPRFGRSAKVVLPGPRLDVLSKVVRDLLDALGVERAHVVGNSMGGQVALKLAIDSPERVGRLVLVAPAALSRSTTVPMPTELIRMIAGYYADEGPSFQKMRQLMRTLVFDPSTVTDEAVHERYEASVDPEVLAVNRGPHWAHQSLEHELDRVAAPTLLVWGQDDRASPFDHALVLLRTVRHARLHVLARCGHSAQAEYPDEFNALTRAFLRG